MWAKSTAHHKERLQEKIEAENEAEQEDYADKDLEEVEGRKIRGGGGMISETLEARIQRLNELLVETMKDMRTAKAMHTLQEDSLPCQTMYEEQEKIQKEKEQVKTDHKATIMRMKK